MLAIDIIPSGSSFPDISNSNFMMSGHIPELRVVIGLSPDLTKNLKCIFMKNRMPFLRLHWHLACTIMLFLQRKLESLVTFSVINKTT